MSQSRIARARLVTKRFFHATGNSSRSRETKKTRLRLEPLEDRHLLSTMGGEPIVSLAVKEVERYPAQEVKNYISSYESSVAAAQQILANLEQQAILDFFRVESAFQQMFQQFLPQAPFSKPNENTPTAQSSAFSNANENGSTAQTASTISGQPKDQNSTSSEPKDQAFAIPGVLLASADGLSPAGGPGGQNSGFTPQQISQAYGFNQITFNNGSVKGDGSGQTIAIVDAYNQPNIVSDLAAFDSKYGLAAPPSFTVVNQTGGTTLPSSDTNWGMEESLDVEWAHAMAPGAKIVLVEANTSSMSDLTTAVSYARGLSNVSVVSMSWGSNGGEFSTETSYDNDFTTPSGHNGVTFVASSGDNGSGGAPEYPSVSPNVIAVGGTVLTTDTAGNYQSETGWSGSGGGISAYESQPKYQNGVVTQSSTMRTVPDVAYNGASGSLYEVYDTSGYGGWIQVYGTSAGAPQWAALVAIADQGRALNGDGTLDGRSQTLPALYQMPSSDFHDITSGSNGAYSAGTGYDLVTGKGTPVANLVVNSLVSYDAWTPVNLSSSYNRNGLTWGGTTITGGGIDGNNDALEGYYNFAWQGATVPLGTVNALDVVSAQGQTITLPAGQYSDLTLFATAVNSGNQTNQQFTVNYSSGPSQTFTRSFTNWLTAPGGYSDEVKVRETNAFNPDGSVKGNGYWSAYALPLDPSRTVTSITLPNDSNIVILAVEVT